MTNFDVAKNWVKAMRESKICSVKTKSKNLHPDGQYLVSYATPIAKFDNGCFQIASRKYSHTTSRHLRDLKSVLENGIEVEEVDEILAPKEAFPCRW